MDVPIDKIQISGACLASLLHRASSAIGDTHGYLFGHAALSISTPLSDHPTAEAPTSLLTTTITSFLSLPSHLPLPPPPPSAASLLGWFSARRKTPLRPSLKDSTASLSLSSSPSLAITPQNSTLSLPPSLFLLLTTPFQDQLIHTHEYKAFRYSGSSFEPKSLSIVNIGPSFRSQYDSFSPNSQFPMMDCELRGPNAMVEDEIDESLAGKRDQLRNQKQLDLCAVGFEIGRLGKLMGSEAAYTAEMEDLYDKMLAKIDALSKLVEQSNAKVLEQENRNMRLRSRVAGLE
ncbi:uncharacterized protein LOC131022716 [Salvia miltiorrhiza]|uniref:uncharacterized protein LOC131022716 n=1 Tax=Salvia miltiorrhiza TaxID=226208 RepID=UPI0025ACA481|nr:uncharacterized protein LOC131022716 [Salvia miltiorrhiza]XP_057808212.1 uncharacterized protein LOC131022716 [Salvia miltiorrhiza]XP_057808213.1 uncharacterized protein LOC131022716 [Salvia miltiorrhiza]